MTDQQKREFLQEQLPYEFWMMHESFNRLCKTTVTEKAVQNALIESFSIHVRNLL
jgi:hypothetical protein